jgi:hypothetical protein
MTTNRRIKTVSCWAVVVLLFLGMTSTSWAQGESHSVVVRSVKHVLTPPLRDLAPVPSRRPLEALEGRVNDRVFLRGSESTTGSTSEKLDLHEPGSVTAGEDVVLPESLAALASATIGSLPTNSGLDILGVGKGFPGYTIQANIAVANGAAGATQYVQFVNESFAVFNKSNGSVIYGPANGNTLWQALGAPCASISDLDESAQYDKLANVWVMLMPLYTNPPYLCVAVSTTSDATGSWNLYAFEIPVNLAACQCRPMPDYPKLGVWPDAYYVSYHQAQNLIYKGPAACALNRSAMLNGTTATMQCFAKNGPSNNAWLPGDLDGTTPPPSGSPEYFVAFDPNDQSLDLWQFHVDWTTPSNSTFTGPTNIPVTPFLEPCGDGVTIFTPQDNCVPQAGTSVMLGAYGDELMYRLAYRNFGSHQSLVVNHTVQVESGNNQVGIRWYELQNTGSGFGLYQEGTYSPDSNYRWMGSIAMDKDGDIAMGYNVSSSSMSPSIRYAGRLSTDSLGTMEGEVDALSSAGVTTTSQTNTSRWGDVSSMAVDPVDDCTFWYTNEYQPAGTTNNRWATRIVSFSFPSCTNVTTTPNWAVVNKASVGNFASSLKVPATGSGNLIAVAIMFNGATTVTGVSDNAGNTYVSAHARAVLSNLSVEIWYAVNSNPGATVITPAFAGPLTHEEITEWEVSGLSTGAPDASNASAGKVTTNNIPGAAVTTTQASDFIVAIMFAGSTNITGMSSGSAFTSDFTTDGNGWAHLTSNSANPGTYQPSWYTPTILGGYLASTVAFAP